MEGWVDLGDLLYIPRWFTHPLTVTHPSTNRAECRLTTLIEDNSLHYAATKSKFRQINDDDDDEKEDSMHASYISTAGRPGHVAYCSPIAAGCRSSRPIHHTRKLSSSYTGSLLTKPGPTKAGMGEPSGCPPPHWPKLGAGHGCEK